MSPRASVLCHVRAAAGLALASACAEAPTAPSRRPLWDVPIARFGGADGAIAVFAGQLLAPTGPEDTRLQAFDAATGATRWLAPLQSLECSPYRIRVRSGVAFIASCGGATAYDASSGQVRWTTRLPDHPNSPTPFAVDSMSLFLIDRVTGRLSALDALSGARRWTWRDTTDSGQSLKLQATVAANGRVYAIGARPIDANRIIQGVILEFDGATGAPLRRFVTPDSISDFRAGTIAGVQRLILSNLARSGIDAFDLNAWQLDWRVRRTGGFMGPYSDPSVVDGVVYAGWQHADALAIDLITGRELWSTAVRGGIWDVAACRNEVVVQHFALTWLDRKTGTVRASNSFEDSSEYPTSDLATDGERVFVTSKGRAYAYRCE